MVWPAYGWLLERHSHGQVSLKVYSTLSEARNTSSGPGNGALGSLKPELPPPHRDPLAVENVHIGMASLAPVMLFFNVTLRHVISTFSMTVTGVTAAQAEVLSNRPTLTTVGGVLCVRFS